MKKYLYLILLASAVFLLKIEFFSSSPIYANYPVTCSYVYGDWSSCDNNAIYRTRTSYSTPTGCCPAINPLVHELCPGASSTISFCEYTYGSWSSCSASGCQYRPYTTYPTGCFQLNLPDIYQTCDFQATTACSYVYGEWSSCVSGYQTRNYTVTPTGCYQTEIPLISQICTSSTSTVPCSYSYGEWSPCNSSGYKTRPYSAAPTGCYQAYAPEVYHTCSTSTYSSSTVPCDYIYGEWSSCNENGYKTRNYTATPTGCYKAYAPIYYQTCTSTSCSYTYSAWSTCSTSTGYQTRTVLSKYPTGCSIITYPVLSQRCSSTATSTISCNYTYGEWSTCSTSTGYKTRAILSKYPPDCYPTINPVLSQKCSTSSTSTVPCSYSYGEWSPCNSSGYKTRPYSAAPTGCYQAYAPEVHRACTTSTYATTTVPCYYTYSDWSHCYPEGYQTRMVLSKYPTGCSPLEAPKTKTECVYNIAPTTTSSITVPIANVPEIPLCKYEYSVWSDCISGQQTRMIIDKMPSICRESVTPVLFQVCKPPIRPASTTFPSDMPAPEPQVVLAPEVINDINFNGKTSDDWQKYYFGQEQCKQKDICGGLADSDKDGLNNNEEYRFGTNPKLADTDHDGYVDADEIQKGRNPLIANSEKNSDNMVFESPKEKGELRQELYKVKNIEMVKTEKEKKSLKITGKALPNIYVTVYVYSDPIVLTIKTDSEGNWSYVFEKPLDEGGHEVYVAVTDNTGKIVAKSEPVAFVQTAEAAVMSNLPPIGAPDKNEVSPTKAWFKGNYTIFIVLGLLGLVMALSAIGLIRSSKKPEDNLRQ